MQRKSYVHVQYRHYHRRPNYLVHVSNNVTFLLTIFHPWLVASVDVESMDAEPMDMEPVDTEG